MDEPLVEFFRILPGGKPPRRASPQAGGTMLHRAVQYCEPSRLGSSFGYYVFLPLTFQVEWDGGTEAIWSFDEGVNWYPLQSAAFPDSYDAWAALAPEGLLQYCPPFITLTDDHGVLQVWSGWFARTVPNYSLLVRAPANLPRPHSYDVYEGIIETDQWFGPLFTNLRLCRIDQPIRFDAEVPFLQVQPLHRSVYAEELLNRFAVREGTEISLALWQAYDMSLVEYHVRHPEQGHYAKQTRRRRREEISS